MLEVIAPEERERILVAIDARLHGAAAESYVTRGLRRDGTTFDLEIFGGTIEVDGERLVSGALRDITEQRAWRPPRRPRSASATR